MNDQHVSAIAMIVQDGLLLVSTGFIFWYLWETRKMRKAAEKQVEKSQAQVDESHRQVTAAYEQVTAIRQQIAMAQEQLEGQIRPALVARFVRDGAEIVNIGSGPALDVKLSLVQRGQAAVITPQPLFRPVAFVERKQTWYTEELLTAARHDRPAARVLAGSSLQCTYKSLSGRTHYTVIDFDGANVHDTRFYEYDGE